MFVRVGKIKNPILFPARFCLTNPLYRPSRDHSQKLIATKIGHTDGSRLPKNITTIAEFKISVLAKRGEILGFEGF